MIKAGLPLSSRPRSLLLTLELAWLINLSLPSGQKRTSIQQLMPAIDPETTFL